MYDIFGGQVPDDRGLDLDIDSVFSDWLADNPELTPPPSFAGDAGGAPASSTSNGDNGAAVVHGDAAAGVAPG